MEGYNAQMDFNKTTENETNYAISYQLQSKIQISAIIIKLKLYNSKTFK